MSWIGVSSIIDQRYIHADTLVREIISTQGAVSCEFCNSHSGRRLVGHVADTVLPPQCVTISSQRSRSPCCRGLRLRIMQMRSCLWSWLLAAGRSRFEVVVLPFRGIVSREFEYSSNISHSRTFVLIVVFEVTFGCQKMLQSWPIAYAIFHNRN